MQLCVAYISCHVGMDIHAMNSVSEFLDIKCIIPYL